MQLPSSSQPSPAGAPSSGLRPERAIRTRLTDLARLGALGSGRIEYAGPAAGDRTDVSVSGIDLRAQDIVPGDLFAALPGARAHGAEFAEQALGRGAVAVLTDPEGLDLVVRANPARTVPVLVHPSPRQVLGEVSAAVYGRPSEKMQVVGITGTSGKTTTSYLVEAALDAGGRSPALVGTIETRIRGRRVPSALTTPEAPQLHALFAVMVEQGIDTVVMEVSSHALALGRVDGVRFDIGAFTNLSQDHLDFHKDLDDYFAAKARLFDGASSVRAETAVVCIDDVWGERMAQVARDGGGKLVTVATRGDRSGDAADWTAGPSRPLPSGTQSFDLAAPDGAAHHAVIQLPGRYNVANASLAVAAASVLGVGVEEAVRGIAEVDVPGRVQRIERGQSFLAVVDYAHKPAAIEAVISTLRAQATGRVAIVVGAGGDRDTGKRALMGAAAARGADLVVVTDDNPRSEDPAAIRAAVLAGTSDVPVADRAEVREVGDRAQAIADAAAWARAGDVVLVAGKGHEIGQEIDGVKHPFDDRDVMSAAIDRLVGGAE